jgi:LuxR family maltose regulon positive regulatory protein
VKNLKLTRSRALYEAFDFASQKKIILIEAPIGYGKTVSSDLWLDHAGKTPLRSSISPYDNDPRIFFRRFLSLLNNACGENTVLESAVASPELDAAPAETTMKALLSLPRSPQKLPLADAILIDNCHFLRNKEILRPLPFILDALPSWITVLLLSRGNTIPEITNPVGIEPNEIGFSFSENGNFARIGPNELRFSPEDAALCFEAHGTYISEREARRLCEATDGWPAPLALTAAAGTTETRKVFSLLERYIEKTVWSHLDDETRNFLTAASVGGEIHPKVCGLLTGAAPNRTLDVLERAEWGSGGLIRGIGDRYVCRKPFLNFLRIRREAREDRKKVYKTALDHYMKKGQWLEAAICAARGNFDERLTDAAARFFRQGMENGSAARCLEDLTKLEDAIPAAKFSELPYLHIAAVRRAHLAGDADEVSHALSRLREAMPEIAAKYPEFLEYALLVNELAPGDNTAARESQFRIRERYAPASSQNLPFFHKGEKDFSGCPGLPENVTWLRKASSIWKGGYKTVEAVLRAGLWYEKNRLAEARASAAEAVESLSDTEIFPEPAKIPPEVVFFTHMLPIAILDARECADEAARLRESLRARLEAADANFLLPNLMAYEAKLRMMSGDARVAEAWLNNYAGAGRKLELHGIFQHLTTARALMVLREPEKARDFLHRLQELAEGFDRVIDKAETMTLLSILEWHRGSENRAVSLLREAIAGVERHGYVRVFADEGGSILPVLSELAKTGEKSTAGNRPGVVFLNEIWEAANKRAEKRAGIARLFPVCLPKLTKQQSLMLEYLADGLGRSDIACRTHLSPDTVKFHVTRLYKKLAVHNVTDAVTKSREMGLI